MHTQACNIFLYTCSSVTSVHSTKGSSNNRVLLCSNLPIHSEITKLSGGISTSAHI